MPVSGRNGAAASSGRCSGFCRSRPEPLRCSRCRFSPRRETRRPSGSGIFVGIALTAIAIIGEAVADAQLQRFRDRHRGLICTDGLWSLSRHPNYFFEWLGWLAYPAFAIDMTGVYPFGWLALIGPALMYVLLVHVSGIPPLERQMLQSRGQPYRDYQCRTSAFVPWPRRRA